MSQSFTFIDVGGNQAQYTVSGKDLQDEFRWSTDHGDHGVAASFEEAQDRARTALKGSMAANVDQTKPQGWVSIPCAADHGELLLLFTRATSSSQSCRPRSCPYQGLHEPRSEAVNR